jgi:putative two-component system response regulator
VREIDQYTSPLDDVDEESDFRFELPDPDSGQVLIVDDDASAATLNSTILETVGYAVTVFGLPSDLLGAIRVGVPTVILTDFHMPEMSGLDLARKAQEVDPDVKVILATGSGDESTAQAALRMGISDYIKKPPEPVALARSVQRAFHERAAEAHHRAMVAWMKLELDRRAQAIRDVTVSTLASLANALDLRSPHFHGHSQAVAMQSAAIAAAMGMSEEEVEAVRVAGLLHDVGMMAVPDALVEKETTLTDEEFSVIRTHCDRGVEILEPMKHLGDSIRYVHEHHERLNGSGYPNGKSGEEISLGGQIVGIAEAWIAIVESRAYRKGMPREEGLQMLRELSGQWFSHEVTEALSVSDIGVI